MSESLVVLNLGSPKSPTPKHVRSFLHQFLMDPLVIDLPWISRAALVFGVITWVRPRKSGRAYASIWNAERGSPLIFNTENFVAKLQRRMGKNVEVTMAMRYAQPSVESVLKDVVAKNPEKITLCAMYPQYALSSNETVLRECQRALKKFEYKGEVAWLKPFHSEPEFIASFASQGRKLLPPVIDDKTYVLMSFHGIPERHLSKLPTYEPGQCLTPRGSCCDELTSRNRDCYRAQSFSTARLLAKALGIKQAQYSVSFQSRLGRTPWIKPYTDFVIRDLAERGYKKIFVFCPSFVTDCLETLEEIQIREAEAFRAHGGEELTLIPCLDSEDMWVDEFAKMVPRMLEPVALI
ncbi:MAG: ferrochelatase [Bdellovibrionota bacterium]